MLLENQNCITNGMLRSTTVIVCLISMLGILIHSQTFVHVTHFTAEGVKMDTRE
jgi:hypothetical protein